MSKSLVQVCMVAAVMLGARVSLAQSIIELRSSARVEAGAAVSLAQIATLHGADATALGEVVIAEKGSSRAAKVTVQDVRRILEMGKVNWGRVTLRGSVCTLVAPAPVKVAAPPVVNAAVLSEDPNSVKRAVADRISRLVQADAESVRLAFDNDDADILNLPTSGRTLEVKPTAASDKLPLALTLYEGDRIVASKSIRVGVLVKRSVVIAAAAKSRGETIAQGDVTIDEQWVGPNVKAATPESVIGASAQGRIGTGQIIRLGDVAPAMIVAKGEQVTVSCVSGSVVLTTKARAMSGGRVGDVIQFQGLEDKRTFAARMSGKGRAVVIAGAGDGTGSEALP
jgi:flagella basal body P-ring formation protein FlgA